MEHQPIVTRFAPSPTGYMHIGNLRTALYAYLLAKSQNGKFILRIEDTDRDRLIEGAVQVILDTLRTAGLHYDEGPIVGGEHGPYVQSERKDIYLHYANQLIETGNAYYCFCSKERLQALHDAGDKKGYDRHCRALSKKEVEENLAAGVPYVIRQKAPTEGTTSYVDAVFGEISVNNEELQDIVLIKADGYPTYNFAHVVDDHLMGITHVVRGSEYVTSTPAYALIYDALGWQRPNYVHLPLIMGKNEDGSVSKLSKRHGAVSFQALIEQGYLPETIVNYIALLGWCPKHTNEEFFTLGELCNHFKVEDINKSPSVFDYEKLLWFNGCYIRNLSPEAFRKAAAPYLHLRAPLNGDRLLSLIQPRVETLSQIPEKTAFFNALPDYDCALFLNKKNKVTAGNCLSLLRPAYTALAEVTDWENDVLFATLKAVAEELGVKSGAIMWVVRIAASGTAVTPGGATDILEILGKDESIKRLQIGLEKAEELSK